MKKKILSLALATALCLGLTTIPAASYKVGDTTITVTDLNFLPTGRIGHRGCGVFHSSTESPSGITVVGSLSEIKEFLYDEHGNLTYEYNMAMDVGEYFRSGLCKIKDFDPYTGQSGWGFMDLYGNRKIAPQFCDAEDFSNGRAVVKDSNSQLYGAIDPSGNLIIPYKYNSLYDFHDGYAYAYSTEEGNSYSGIIDKDGWRVYQEPKAWIPGFGGLVPGVHKHLASAHFYEGYALVYGNEVAINPETNRLEIARKDDGTYDETQYTYLLNSEDWSYTQLPNATIIADYMGLPRIFGCYSPSANRMVVSVDGHYGAMDRTGKLVIPYLYKKIYTFYKGIALAQNTDGLWGFIDPNGNPVTPFEWSFTWPENYSQGIAFEESNILYAVHKDTQQIYKLELTQGDEVPTQSTTPPVQPTQPTQPPVAPDEDLEDDLEDDVPVIPPTQIPATGTAYATSYPISVDGTLVNFDAYAVKDANGNDTNYIKIRDLAHVLSTGYGRFDVQFANGVIDLIPTLVYVDNGTEMKAPFTGNQPYQVNPSPVTLDGAPINMSAITLTDANGGGYTYFKLRDVGLAIGFDVTWNAETGITITTHPF